jgi:mono/diheme cytochrome c family protein
MLRRLLYLFLVLPMLQCTDNPYRQGEILYRNFCANCHMEDGSGLQGLIPPLAGADWIHDNPKELACVIRYGMKGEIIVNGKIYNEVMPGVQRLTDFEIANVINYINHAWGNEYGYAKYEDVKTALEECKDRTPILE